MNINEERYKRYHLVKEMYDSVNYIKNFSARDVYGFLQGITPGSPLMLTGEGSSRIFPAKNAVHRRLMANTGPLVLTESSTDLAGKNLEGFVVLGASNSGKTKELVTLFRDLKAGGHKQLYGLTCNRDTLLEKYSEKTYIIDAGPEKAVAASKTVVAQALFYDLLLAGLQNEEFDTPGLATAFEDALNYTPAERIVELICNAGMVWFSGNNNGVAEELTLKTNEIIRKKASYLPGTYLLHGVEEVMSPDDIIIMVDAYPGEFDKIMSVYTGNIGTPVVAISDTATPFNNVAIPDVPERFEPYVKLAAGWNLLVEAGIRLGIDPDKPVRARKIGNEASG
ncbi:MAG: sugar isomerase [Marinilabiliales bacterium]|nr:MAG: sugar isomerase [Marinilabiliales bacterium]